MWLSQVAKHEPIIDTLGANAFFRRIMRYMPVPDKPWSMGILVDEDGRVLEVFEDPKGEMVHGTSVYAEHKGRVFIGTFQHNFIVVCDRE